MIAINLESATLRCAIVSVSGCIGSLSATRFEPEVIHIPASLIIHDGSTLNSVRDEVRKHLAVEKLAASYEGWVS